MKKIIIILGAQKAGTTSLYTHIKNAGVFSTPSSKEMHYFDTVKNPSLSSYLSKFSNLDSDSASPVYLEATPSYLYDIKAFENMVSVFGGESIDLRLIVCVRDPLDRAWSHFRMNVRKGHEKIDDFVSAFERKSRDNIDSYYHRGLYSGQIDRYVNEFGRNHVLVLNFHEDFKDIENLNGKLELFLEEKCSFANELSTENSSRILDGYIFGMLSKSELLRSTIRLCMSDSNKSFILSLFSKKMNRKKTMNTNNKEEYMSSLHKESVDILYDDFDIVKKRYL